MGMLGYTEQETLDTSIPALELAYDGLMELEMLRLRGAFAPVASAPPPAPPPSSESVFAVFRAAATPPARRS